MNDNICKSCGIYNSGLRKSKKAINKENLAGYGVAEFFLTKMIEHDTGEEYLIMQECRTSDPDSIQVHSALGYMGITFLDITFENLLKSRRLYEGRIKTLSTI